MFKIIVEYDGWRWWDVYLENDKEERTKIDGFFSSYERAMKVANSIVGAKIIGSDGINHLKRDKEQLPRYPYLKIESNTSKTFWYIYIVVDEDEYVQIGEPCSSQGDAKELMDHIKESVENRKIFYEGIW